MWKASMIQPYGRFRIPATFPVDYLFIIISVYSSVVNISYCVAVQKSTLFKCTN
jgi:hypothetical protein